MSGLLVFFIGVATLPFAMHIPIIAVLAYEWYQYLVPSSIAWGPLLKQPYSLWFGTCAIVTWLLFEKKSLRDFNIVLILMGVYFAWINVTTLFADAAPAFVAWKWERTVKVIIFSMVAALVLRNRQRIEAFVLIFVACVCFHSGMAAVKTVLGSGGAQLAAEGGFVADRNQLAVVMLMSLPLLVFLRNNMTLIPRAWWSSFGLTLAMVGVPLAAVGTQSRGALVAGLVLGSFYFVKAKRKGMVFVAILVAGVSVVLLAPENWFGRMSTLGSYERDASAMGRIEAWAFGIETAVRDPLFSGGFRVFEGIHGRAAHSIYFEVLGEHGFIGLAIYLALFLVAYVNLGRIIRKTRSVEDMEWAGDLARSLQILFVVYAVGGAFLSMAHYPMFFDFLAVTVGLMNCCREIRPARSAQANWRRGGRVGVPAPGPDPNPNSDPVPVGIARRGLRPLHRN